MHPYRILMQQNRYLDPREEEEEEEEEDGQERAKMHERKNAKNARIPKDIQKLCTGPFF